jgi:hypothetical protein
LRQSSPDRTKLEANPVPHRRLAAGSTQFVELLRGLLEARFVLRELRLLGGAIGFDLAELRREGSALRLFLLQRLPGLIERLRLRFGRGQLAAQGPRLVGEGRGAVLRLVPDLPQRGELLPQAADRFFEIPFCALGAGRGGFFFGDEMLVLELPHPENSKSCRPEEQAGKQRRLQPRRHDDGIR